MRAASHSLSSLSSLLSSLNVPTSTPTPRKRHRTYAEYACTCTQTAARAQASRRGVLHVSHDYDDDDEDEDEDEDEDYDEIYIIRFKLLEDMTINDIREFRERIARTPEGYRVTARGVRRRPRA